MANRMNKGPMDDDRFEHMLKLSVIYIPVLRDRALFEGVDEMDDADRHGMLNCLEIVAETFVEMQRRLGVKPKLRMKAGMREAEAALANQHGEPT